MSEDSSAPSGSYRMKIHHSSADNVPPQSSHSWNSLPNKLLLEVQTLLVRAGIDPKPINTLDVVRKTASSMFVAIFEAFFNVCLENIVRKPVRLQDFAQNAQVVIDTLEKDVICTCLDHITGRAIAEGELKAITNLTEIFMKISDVAEKSRLYEQNIGKTSQLSVPKRSNSKRPRRRATQICPAPPPIGAKILNFSSGRNARSSYLSSSEQSINASNAQHRKTQYAPEKNGSSRYVSGFVRGSEMPYESTSSNDFLREKNFTEIDKRHAIPENIFRSNISEICSGYASSHPSVNSMKIFKNVEVREGKILATNDLPNSSLTEMNEQFEMMSVQSSSSNIPRPANAQSPHIVNLLRHNIPPFGNIEDAKSDRSVKSLSNSIPECNNNYMQSSCSMKSSSSSIPMHNDSIKKQDVINDNFYYSDKLENQQDVSQNSLENDLSSRSKSSSKNILPKSSIHKTVRSNTYSMETISENGHLDSSNAQNNASSSVPSEMANEPHHLLPETSWATDFGSLPRSRTSYGGKAEKHIGSPMMSARKSRADAVYRRILKDRLVEHRKRDMLDISRQYYTLKNERHADKVRKIRRDRFEEDLDLQLANQRALREKNELGNAYTDILRMLRRQKEEDDKEDAARFKALHDLSNAQNDELERLFNERMAMIEEEAQVNKLERNAILKDERHILHQLQATVEERFNSRISKATNKMIQAEKIAAEQRAEQRKTVLGIISADKKARNEQIGGLMFGQQVRRIQAKSLKKYEVHRRQMANNDIFKAYLG